LPRVKVALWSVLKIGGSAIDPRARQDLQG
jgi:hypothetical protein